MVYSSLKLHSFTLPVLCCFTMSCFYACAKAEYGSSKSPPPPNPKHLTASKSKANQGLPLKIKGRWIYAATGERVKLASVNWYGASDAYHVPMGLDKNSVAGIADLIKSMGFNSVRLPFSNEMLSIKEKVPQKYVSADSSLFNLTPLQVFDQIVKTLAAKEIFIILNNHTSIGKWCCKDNDDNGLWYNKQQSPSQWMADWQMLIERYKSNPWIIGADLRNEIRKDGGIKPSWGDQRKQDFHAISQRLGNKLLKIAPNLFIIVEGLEYSSDFRAVRTLQITLDTPNRVIYSPHSYQWFRTGVGTTLNQIESYDEFKSILDTLWGFISELPEPRPIWISEWGISPKANNNFSRHFPRYLKEKDFGWAWWPLNVGRKPKSKKNETWGIVDPSWSKARANDHRIAMLKSLMPPLFQ